MPRALDLREMSEKLGRERIVATGERLRIGMKRFVWQVVQPVTFAGLSVRQGWVEWSGGLGHDVYISPRLRVLQVPTSRVFATAIGF